MKTFWCVFDMFVYGGLIYCLIELLYRGRTHPSMYAVGGLCFLLVGYCVNRFLPWELGLVWQAIIGGVVITLIELPAGFILNIWLKLGVWDYSSLRFNFMGQISAEYFLKWVVVAAFAILLMDFLLWQRKGEQRPQYTWFKWEKKNLAVASA